ncbi:MAG: transporter substrate-binding protein [Nocardioides sp.]|nr:transporter substrate-binding protein [Nocardioides sp.]
MFGAPSRRDFLRLSGTLAVAGLAAGCGSPFVSSLTGSQPATADVIYWHLFGGGDGANMATMVQDVQRTSGLSVEATLLSWGNPYYTKLALAASSGRPPDVAISHLSRLPLLAEAGLIESVDEAGLTDAGITRDKFTPAAWSKATVSGTTYAVPLDTHPFVMFYNRTLADKAGLLDGSGRLKPMSGRQGFLDAITAMKDAGGEYGAISSNTADPSTTWRFFLTLYSGLAGPVVEDQGTTITLDRSAAEETFALMQELTVGKKLMPSSATITTVSTLFGQGKVGFLFDGVWQIPTYRGIKLPSGDPLDFDVVPFPAILGDQPRSYADSHALIIPRSGARSEERSRNAVTFVKGLLDDSAIWADGGHVPAWLPTQQSKEFKAKKPQSNYVRAAFDAVYDPPAWYTGAGSDFQNSMGAVITKVLAGQTTPGPAVDEMTAGLQTYADAKPPVG